MIKELYAPLPVRVGHDLIVDDLHVDGVCDDIVVVRIGFPVWFLHEDPDGLDVVGVGVGEDTVVENLHTLPQTLPWVLRGLGLLHLQGDQFNMAVLF